MYIAVYLRELKEFGGIKVIQLIAIDLDGTLLNDRKQITKQTQAVLKAARTSGVRIVLCSGRPLRGIDRYLRVLGLTNPGDFAVTYNGGLVQKSDSGEVISEKILTRDQLLSLYALSQERDLPMNFIDREKVYCPPYPKQKPSLYGTVMKTMPFVKADMEHLPADIRINKAVFCISEKILTPAIAEIPQSYRKNYTMVKSHPYLLEILNKDADKGKALQTLTHFLGLASSEVMAIGDEENDLAMIRFAGLGIAMGNAIDALKAEAQFVTKTNEQEGVAYAIEKCVLKR